MWHTSMWFTPRVKSLFSIEHVSLTCDQRNVAHQHVVDAESLHSQIEPQSERIGIWNTGWSYVSSKCIFACLAYDYQNRSGSALELKTQDGHVNRTVGAHWNKQDGHVNRNKVSTSEGLHGATH